MTMARMRADSLDFSKFSTDWHLSSNWPWGDTQNGIEALMTRLMMRGRSAEGSRKLKAYLLYEDCTRGLIIVPCISNRYASLSWNTEVVPGHGFLFRPRSGIDL